MFSDTNIEETAAQMKLQLAKEEKEDFVNLLNEMLAWTQQIDQAEIEEEKISQNLSGLQNRFREDGVQPSMEIQKVFQNARDAKDGYFRVPSVLE